MVNLTLRDLFYDKGKFMLIIAGLTASMLMMHFGTAMFNGTLKESTIIIDECESDAWIAQEYRDDILSDSYILDETYNEIEKLECIDKAEKLVYNFAGFEFDKDIYTIMTYGYDLSSDNLGPWELTDGHIKDLKKQQTIILDESVKRKYPKMEKGDSAKINDVEVEVVGFCKNAKWFMNPIAFMSLETARSVMFMENKSSFIVINLKEGFDFNEFAKQIKDFKDISLYTPEEIRANTRDFMIYESGMGIGIGIMVIMGVFIGLLIIILTIYSSVKEKTPEFGTLKALGANKNFIKKYLVGQILIFISISYLLGFLIAYVFGRMIMTYAMMPFYTEPISIILLFMITMGLGIISGFLGVRSIQKIDPGIVFRS